MWGIAVEGFYFGSDIKNPRQHLLSGRNSSYSIYLHIDVGQIEIGVKREFDAVG